LEPDATMLRRGQANNARLLKVYPQGFTLKDRAERTEIRSHIVRDLTDIGDLISAVTTTLADALVQRNEELAVD
jgi:hypothetical protein